MTGADMSRGPRALNGKVDQLPYGAMSTKFFRIHKDPHPPGAVATGTSRFDSVSEEPRRYLPNGRNKSSTELPVPRQRIPGVSYICQH